jgi:arylsulfatase A-like enzyme
MPDPKPLFCALLLPVALSIFGGCSPDAPPPDHPNVLIVVMDTTRGDRVSLNGFSRPTTPKLEAFAEDATVFEDAWSPAGWTGPAHASLFTGLRPENHGFVRGNRDFLPGSFDTLAEILHRKGYQTVGLTNNMTLSPQSGVLQGFDRVARLYADERRPYPWAPATHRIALGFIDDAVREKRPFFVFINDMEPHFPYTPPREWADRFVESGIPEDAVQAARLTHPTELFAHNLGAKRIPPDRLRILSDLYDAEIACLDHFVGELLDGLRERGVLDETIVVVTSDHGENFNEHGFVDHMFSIHRAICHVPLLIRYPPHFSGGGRVRSVVRLEDVAPTVLEMANLDVPEGLDGESLLRNLPNRVSRGIMGPPDAFLARIGPELKPGDDLLELRTRARSVYDGRYHLIVYSDGREELYDLATDPREAVNLAALPTGPRNVAERLKELIPEP